MTLTNLGSAYGSLGNPKKQKELLERTLPIFARDFGEGHISFAMALSILAEAHVALRDFGAAADASERAQRLARAALAAPNAIVAELGLSAAIVRRAISLEAAAPSEEHVEENAESIWRDATQELLDAVGPGTDVAVVETFATRATVFWRSSGREDLISWLQSMEAEKQRLAEEQAERERLAAEEAEKQRLAEERAEGERLAAEEA